MSEPSVQAMAPGPTSAARPGSAGGRRLRPRLSDLGLSPGKRTRLKRLLYDYGPGGGTLLVLPIDQGLEHGPMDFFVNPDALDPEYQYRLARDGRFSAIALHIGLAEKYYHRYAGEVPLILKLNGKTGIPSDAEAFSALTGSVEDAVRLGADAVGYTVYVGSPSQDRDFAQFHRVREDADRLGMPVIVWAYPRGDAVAKKGGRESLYAIDYAARVALELGADVVKVNYPVRSEKDQLSPPPYNTLDLSPEAAFHKVVESAGRALVLVSGGEKVSDADLLTKVRSSMDAGATGIIFGRNLWQRPRDQALSLTKELHAIFREYAQPLA
ncbi:MAG TPA: fructose-bisphosphate aldolase [Thermoplasmata archaeon]|nr:fructose-bisphosphate aldolase [Thermoplasmata archaeon]